MRIQFEINLDDRIICVLKKLVHIRVLYTLIGLGILGISGWVYALDSSDYKDGKALTGTLMQAIVDAINANRTKLVPITVSSSNVGVNNATPTVALDVTGDAKVSGTMVVTGETSLASTLSVDTISEKTSSASVTVNNTLKVNTIQPKTGTSVTISSKLLAGAEVYRGTHNFAGGPTLFDMDTKIYDINNDYDLATDKFTASVAGYYLVSGQTSVNELQGQLIVGYIYKNGVEYINNSQFDGVVGQRTGVTVTAVMYLNIGDYVQLYGSCTHGGTRDFNSNRLTIAYLGGS